AGMGRLDPATHAALGDGLLRDRAPGGAATGAAGRARRRSLGAARARPDSQPPDRSRVPGAGLAERGAAAGAAIGPDAPSPSEVARLSLSGLAQGVHLRGRRAGPHARRTRRTDPV